MLIIDSLSSLFAFIQANSTSANGTATSKKDSAPLPKTPLQKLLSDAGPLKSDGSDKFFGMENVSPFFLYLLAIFYYIRGKLY